MNYFDEELTDKYLTEIAFVYRLDHTIIRGSAREAMAELEPQQLRKKEWSKRLRQKMIERAEHHTWDQHFLKLQATVEGAETIDFNEFQLLFKYALDREVRQARRRWKSGQQPNEKDWTMREVLRLRCEEYLPWLAEHPERQLLKRLRDGDAPAWQALYDNFTDRCGDKFGEYIQDAMVELKFKLGDEDFRLFCGVETFLQSIVRNLKIKNYDQQRKTEELDENIAETNTMASDLDQLDLENSDVQSLAFLRKLIFYHLKYKLEHLAPGEILYPGIRIDQKRLTILFVRYFGDHSVEEMVAQFEKLTGKNQARQWIYRDILKLRKYLGKILFPKISGIIGSIQWSTQEKGLQKLSLGAPSVLCRYCDNSGRHQLGLFVDIGRGTALTEFWQGLNFLFEKNVHLLATPDGPFPSTDNAFGWLVLTVHHSGFRWLSSRHYSPDAALEKVGRSALSPLVIAYDGTQTYPSARSGEQPGGQDFQWFRNYFMNN